MPTSRRVYWQKVATIGLLPPVIGLIAFLALQGDINITGYSGDMACWGADMDGDGKYGSYQGVSEACYAYINFTMNKNYIYIYPNQSWYIGTNEEVSDIKLQVRDNRVTGGWKTIDLTKPASSSVSYAYRFYKTKGTWEIRYMALKHDSFDKIKWSFGSVDPEWLPPSETDGISQWVNDSRAYFWTNPASLTTKTSDNKLISKVFTGEVDLIIATDDEDFYPLYEDVKLPWNETIVKEEQADFMNVSNILSTTLPCVFGNEYNLNKKRFNYTILWTNPVSNTTQWNTTWTVGCYDSYQNVTNDYRLHWNTTSIIQHDTRRFYYDTKENLTIQGMKIWYKKQLPVVEDVLYESTTTFNLPIRLGVNGGKYLRCIKPSAETIQQAIANDHLYCLEPWWNTSWSYRKQMNFTNNDAVAYTYYPMSGWLDTEGHANENQSDIRIATDADVEYTDWCMKDCNTTGCTVAILGNLPAYDTNSTFYAYYGNAEATSYSNKSYWDYCNFTDSFEDNDYTALPAWTFTDDGANIAASMNTTLYLNGTHSIFISGAGASSWNWVKWTMTLPRGLITGDSIEGWFYQHAGRNGNGQLGMCVGNGCFVNNSRIDLAFQVTGWRTYYDASYTDFGTAAYDTWYKLKINITGANTADVLVYNASGGLVTSSTGKTITGIGGGTHKLITFQGRDIASALSANIDQFKYILPVSNATTYTEGSEESSGIIVTLNDPVDSSYMSSPTWLNATVSGGAGSGNCYLYGNFTGTWAYNTTWAYSVDTENGTQMTLSDNVYIWNVYCNDTSSNDWGDANYTVTIDSTSPSVTITSPTASSHNYPIPSIVGTSSDASSGVKNCSITSGPWDGDDTTTPLTFSFANTTSAALATHSVTVICYDNAENNGTATVSFYYDAPLLVRQWVEATEYGTSWVRWNLTIWVYNNATVSLDVNVTPDTNFGSEYTISGLAANTANTTQFYYNLSKPASSDENFNITAPIIELNATGTGNTIMMINPSLGGGTSAVDNLDWKIGTWT